MIRSDALSPHALSTPTNFQHRCGFRRRSAACTGTARMRMVISRRTFLHRTFLRGAASYAAAYSLAPHRHFGTRPPVVLRIGALESADAGSSARRSGVLLGVEEAQHAAALFGGRVELVPATAKDFQPAAVSAAIGDSDASHCALCASRAADAGVPFVNVACADDALRGADCRRTLFHVAPSDAMYRDALALRGGSAHARVAAWDPSLERFGADTLNERFHTRFGQEMTADAWAGWAAVKILWESSLRARSADGGKLVAYMAADTTQFDGHKGRPLSFRTWDRQLRQPVYVVNDSGIVEMPPAKDGESFRESLDRIGTPAGQSQCRPQ
jgi:hypothetical protein